MTSYYGTSTNYTQTQIEELGYFDRAFVDRGVTLRNTGRGFDLDTRSSVTIAGTLITNSTAIYAYDTEEDSNQLVVADSGIIISESWAAQFRGEGNSILNDGLIDSLYGITMDRYGSITNNGSMISSGEALSLGQFGSNNSFTVINTGTIMTRSNARVITFSGNGTLFLVNDGTITGGDRAIEWSGNSGTGTFDIVNRGIIASKVRVAIETGYYVDTVTNQGLISGSVLLGYGDDVFDGAGGTVSGAVNGGFGDDVLSGGEGVDRLRGDVGEDTLSGGNGDDVLEGGINVDQLDGGAGNDVLDGGYGADTLIGGEGRDVARYSYASGLVIDLATPTLNTGDAEGDVLESIEIIRGSSGNDRLYGNSAANVFQGDDDDDVIEGREGNDLLYGQAGDDTVNGGAGNDRLLGGAGTDTASYADAAAAVTVSLLVSGMQNTGGSGRDVLEAIEILVGSAFADTLTGSYQDNVLSGGAGNDKLDGSLGDDRLIGGGNTDQLTGGDGIDTADYADAAAGVTVNLAQTSAQNTGGAGTDTLATIENLAGSGFNDTLTGDVLANLLDGAGANDTLNGGDGDDRLKGGAGDDTLNGGSGIDLADYSNNPAGVTVNLGITGPQLTGSAGTDTFVSIEGVIGTAFRDILRGDAGANVFRPGAGDDDIDGITGLDTVIYSDASSAITIDLNNTAAQNTGGSGTDRLFRIENIIGTQFDDGMLGTEGANRLEGGGGPDILYGNGGNDTLKGGFDYAADVIDGGSDDDTLFAYADGDTFDGGNGFDTLTYAEAFGLVAIYIGAGSTYTLGSSETFTGIEAFVGSKSDDYFYAGSAVSRLTGGLGADRFSFEVGTAAGDTITDFSGSGGHGDKLVFTGFGAGATFTQLDATHYRISNAAGTINEIITFTNAPNIELASDVIFS